MAQRKNKRHASRKPEVTQANKELFVVQLFEGVGPGEAAMKVGVARSTAYAWKKDDADFNALWENAVETSLDKVETKLFSLALNGNLQAIEFLLKWRRRPVYNNTSDSDRTNNTTNFIMNVTMQEHLERCAPGSAATANSAKG
jgi:hypothetical protein